MKFEFLTAGRLIFGLDTLPQALPLIHSLGSRPLLVTGRSRERAAQVIAGLQKLGSDVEMFSIEGEPTIGTIREGVARARSSKRDLLVGFGGGSALDGAKAIAGLTPNPGDILEYLEVIGEGRALSRPALPVAAIQISEFRNCRPTLRRLTCNRHLDGSGSAFFLNVNHKK